MSPFRRSATKDMIALMVALLTGAALVGQPGRPGVMLSEDVPQISVAVSMATLSTSIGHAPPEFVAARGA